MASCNNHWSSHIEACNLVRLLVTHAAEKNGSDRGKRALFQREFTGNVLSEG